VGDEGRKKDVEWDRESLNKKNRRTRPRQERRARAAVQPPKNRRSLGHADESLLSDEFAEILGKVFLFE